LLLQFLGFLPCFHGFVNLLLHAIEDNLMAGKDSLVADILFFVFIA
jgi:hypothetical protein